MYVLCYTVFCNNYYQADLKLDLKTRPCNVVLFTNQRAAFDSLNCSSFLRNCK